MYEIELKAHVENYNETKKTIDEFAEFIGEKTKSDTYWKLKKNKDEKSMKIRVREEKSLQKEEILVTYKRKEVKKDAGTEVHFEVNEEKEFTISDRNGFETILEDIGFKIAYTKEKKVLQWKVDTVLLELCTVPPLGNFLELEILSESNVPEETNKCIKKLQKVLKKSNIPQSKIEKRYYSEMLQEK